jgi:hypothetical protein
MRSESNAQGRKARRISNPVPSPVGWRIPCGSRKSCPSALSRAHPGSGRGPHLDGFTIQAEDGEPESQPVTQPMRLPSAAGALAGSSSMAEGARIERAWDASPNLGSANRCYCRSASLPSRHGTESNRLSIAALQAATRPARTAPECPRRESNPHVRRHTGLSRARLPLRHRGMEWTTGIEPAVFCLASRCDTSFATSTWSLLGESNSDYRRTEAACCHFH